MERTMALLLILADVAILCLAVRRVTSAKLEQSLAETLGMPDSDWLITLTFEVDRAAQCNTRRAAATSSVNRHLSADPFN
jgi:hypothetical protein